MKLTNSSCVERLWLQITHTYTVILRREEGIKVSVCLHVRTPYSFTVCYRVLLPVCLFLFFSHRFKYIHRIANFQQISCAFSTKFLDRSHLSLTLCSPIHPVQNTLHFMFKFYVIVSVPSFLFISFSLLNFVAVHLLSIDFHANQRPENWASP